MFDAGPGLLDPALQRSAERADTSGAGDARRSTGPRRCCGASRARSVPLPRRARRRCGAAPSRGGRRRRRNRGHGGYDCGIRARRAERGDARLVVGSHGALPREGRHALVRGALRRRRDGPAGRPGKGVRTARSMFRCDGRRRRAAPALRSTSRVSCDAYRVQGDLRVSEDGDERWHRTWTNRILETTEQLDRGLGRSRHARNPRACRGKGLLEGYPAYQSTSVAASSRETVRWTETG